MKRDIQTALDEVEITYDELNQIAKSMTTEIFSTPNTLVEEVSNNVYSMSIDKLREMLMKLSIASYSLAEIKDKAALKQEVSETIKKAKYAEQFNLSEGSVAVRENIALLSSAEETLTNLVYDLVASMVKTKVDELHRIVDTLKTIIVSKMQEYKMTQLTAGCDIGEKTYLAE